MSEEADLTAFVAALLGLPLHNEAQHDVPLAEGLEADILLAAPDGTLYVVEVKAGSLDPTKALGQLLLYKAALQRERPGARIVPVLVLRHAPPRVRRMADVADVRVIEAPPALLPRADRLPGKVRLTTPASWNVVAALAHRRVVKGLRALSEESGASLGWVHSVVKELEARGIADTTRGGVTLVDAQKLLDAIALERPLKPLLRRTLAVDADGTDEAARELTRRLETRLGTERGFAFCAYTAAGIHSAYARRHDRLDLYVQDWDDSLADAFSEQGLRVHVYEPDRDLHRHLRKVDGVSVTDWSLTVLDLAGFGWAARDLVLKLMEAPHDA